MLDNLNYALMPLTSGISFWKLSPGQSTPAQLYNTVKSLPKVHDLVSISAAEVFSEKQAEGWPERIDSFNRQRPDKGSPCCSIGNCLSPSFTLLPAPSTFLMETDGKVHPEKDYETAYHDRPLLGYFGVYISQLMAGVD